MAIPRFPYLAEFSKPFCLHRQSAPEVSRFRAGCAATPEAPLLSISVVLPGFPQTRAPWPVWRSSVPGPVRFAAISRKQAAKLWHKARRWDRETRRPGRHGGVIGRTALATLYTLLFDFLNHRTGRLDPSLDAIAHKAGCCRRAVVDALARLRDLGLLFWQRRCEETATPRATSGCASAPTPTGYCRRHNGEAIGTRPPPPDPTTLGAPERVPDPLEAAVAELTNGQRMAALATLEADPGDKLASALAALGRAMGAV